jgi:hypothetical protein
VIHEPQNLNDMKYRTSLFIQRTLNRRDTWSSRQVDTHIISLLIFNILKNRQEALDSFLKNPFFQAWDPAVLKIYVECGIYLTKDEQGKEVAKLKMPGILEAVFFSHFITSYEVYERLVNLDERIILRWLAPGKPGAKELGPPGSTKHRVWVRPKNSTNVRILGGGHLVRLRVFIYFLLIRSQQYVIQQQQIAQEAPQELGMCFFCISLFYFYFLIRNNIL